MPKIRIKLIALGHLPRDFDKRKVLAWSSDVFEVVGQIEHYSLRVDSDIENSWAYSDESLASEIPEDVTRDVDFCIALVAVPLQLNWYARRLSGNRVVFTFHEIADVLRTANIPLANVVLRALYSYSLLFLRNGRRIPNYGEVPGYTHDETRGCLFDMNGLKFDLPASCDGPIVCDECVQKLRIERVPDGTVSQVMSEIRKIRMDSYFRVVAYVQAHPWRAFFASSFFALVVGVAASVLASFIYEAIK